MRKHALFCLALFLAALLSRFTGVAAAMEGSKSNPIKVMATTSIIADLVANVGGADVEISTLVGTDGDPHEYQPVPADSVKLSDAAMIFENGLGLEQWLDKLYRGAGAKGERVVVSDDGVTVRHVPGAADDRDPHAFQNVQDAIVMVRNIRDALIKADPVNQAGYAARADAYIKQLEELDGFVMARIHSIPVGHRKLVTSHDAFGYFAERYGLEVNRSALESVTTEASDPSARKIAEVVEQIKSAGVPVIFVENIQNPKLMNQIASEAGVIVGPPLYSDALGAAGSAGDTYLKMMRYNAETMAKALGQ